MIVSSAIKTKSGRVFTGRRHGDCFRAYKELVGVPDNDVLGAIQGFITDAGDFLSREDAYAHATASGQIDDEGLGVLMSEDIFKPMEMRLVKGCPHCEFLSSRFCVAADSDNREYWLMTEVFVYLHGSDVCKWGK